MKCRMCESEELELFLNLGDIPRVDRFLTKEELDEPEPFYPLKVCFCKKCGLIQLSYIVPAKELFNENYAYESNTTKTRQDNHHELATNVCKNYKIPKNSLVIDIGSNVGMLLEFFKEENMQVVGIDASSNVVEIANKKGIETICGFFNDDIADKILSEKGKAKIVTATNVFAHIQNYASFMKSLTKIFDEDGIFVIQVPHFLHLLKNLEYDTIYHEHISYFGLKPLMHFFNKFNMEIFDVIETTIDGGSIRCFVSIKGKHTISTNVERILKEEENENVYSLQRLKTFANDVVEHKQKLRELLISLNQQNKKVIGVGAPAKGMTLLNYCKIGSDILSYVTEKSALKIGKYTPGMHIPVKSDEELMKDKPDYALILAWNFADEIMRNLENFKKNGGKFIVPIPSPKII